MLVPFNISEAKALKFPGPGTNEVCDFESKRQHWIWGKVLADLNVSLTLELALYS